MVIVTYFFSGSPLLPHGLLFPIGNKGSFICTFPTDRIANTTAFDRPVVDHWLELKIAQTANAYTMPDLSAMPEDSNLYSRVPELHPAPFDLVKTIAPWPSLCCPCYTTTTRKLMGIFPTHQIMVFFSLTASRDMVYPELPKAKIPNMQYANVGCLSCSKFVMEHQSSWLTLSHPHRSVHGWIHLRHPHPDIWKHHSVYTLFSILFACLES